MIGTNWTPLDLYCLQNGDIVVSLRFYDDSKVVIYCRNGQIRQTLDHIKFRHPMSLSVNQVNQDFYICDKESNTFYSVGRVIALDADYKLRYMNTPDNVNVSSIQRGCVQTRWATSSSHTSTTTEFTSWTRRDSLFIASWTHNKDCNSLSLKM